MENLHQQVMEIFGGRQMFLSVNPADLEETMAQIVQHVAMATEARIRNEKRRRFVYIRTFVDALEAQTWVNTISITAEVVDVTMEIGGTDKFQKMDGATNTIWVMVATLESLEKTPPTVKFG